MRRHLARLVLTALAVALPPLVRPDLALAAGVSVLLAVTAGALAPPRLAAATLLAAAAGLCAASARDGLPLALLSAVVAALAAALGVWLRPGAYGAASKSNWTTELARRFGRANDPGPDHADRLVRAAARVVTDSVDRTVEVARAALRANVAAVLWLDPRASACRLVAVSPATGSVPDHEERHPFLAALRKARTPTVRDADAVTSTGGWRGVDPEPHLAGICLTVDGVPRGYLIAERDRANPPFGEREAALLEALGGQVLDILEREELILDAARARSDIGLHFEAADLFNRSVTVDDVCRAARTMLERIVKLDLFIVTRNREDGKTQLVVHADGPGAALIVGRELDHPDSLVAIATRQLDIQPFTGVLRHNDAPLLDPETTVPGIRGIRVFPLTVGGECVGTFVLGTGDEAALDTATTERLRVVVQLGAAALANALAYAWAVKAATTDSMTGLTNHRTFKERATDALLRAERSGRPLSVILTDIDHFKRVNDTWGHSVGDEVIIAVADVLRSSLRRVDLGARYGGEEFAVLLEEADTSAAVALAERIRDAAAARRFDSGGRSFGVTLSLGVATYPRDGRSVAELIEAADRALYAAKRGGRNQTVRADDPAAGPMAQTAARPR